MTALPKGWDVRPIGELGKWSGGGNAEQSKRCILEERYYSLGIPEGYEALLHR
jgi:hypothetical protein